MKMLKNLIESVLKSPKTAERIYRKPIRTRSPVTFYIRIDYLQLLWSIKASLQVHCSH